MNNYKLFYSFFVVIVTKGKSENDVNVLVVGGKETTIESYPYQAFLTLYNGNSYFQCGGSIVSKYSIVTAAHCLSGITEIQVTIGSTKSSSGGSRYGSTTFFTHPQYNSSTHDYDVGVIRVREGMNLDGTYARAVTMVNMGYDPSEGDEMTVTGWGYTSENGTVSNTLVVAQVPVVPRERCNELLNNSVTSRMFCAGFTEGGIDTCQGDSGGPAVESTSGKQVGITSFGYGCARPNTPGVYALLGNVQVRLFIRLYTGQ